LGICKSCDPTCKSCAGPNYDECLECYPGYIYSTIDFTCKPCEYFTGLFTNEELECEDICGDGIIVNKECDDGNAISNDGCSNLCLIEYGFECSNPN